MNFLGTLCLALNICGYFYNPADWLHFPVTSEIRSITSGPSNEYITVSEGIFVLDKFTNNIERTIISSDGISFPIKLTAYDAEMGILWILSEYGDRLTEYYPHTNIKYEVNLPFRTNSLGVADKYIYFDFGGSKIFRMDKRTLSFSVAKKLPKTIIWYGERSLTKLRNYSFLTPYFYYDDYFNRYEITCIFQEPNKLWVGTNGYGALIYQLSSTRLLQHIQFGLKNISKRIWKTNEGLWFLTEDFPPTLIRYNPETEEWKYFDTRPGFLSAYSSDLISFKFFDLMYHEEIMDLIQDNKSFWISTDRSLYFYDTHKSILENILLPDGRRLNNINTLFLYSNQLLIGTDNGLLIYNKMIKRFLQIKDPNQELNWGVFDIVQGKDRLYFATYGGVVTLNNSANQTLHLLSNYYKADTTILDSLGPKQSIGMGWGKVTIAGFNRQTPITALAYAPGYLFIGYSGGIIVYNEKYGNYEFLTTQQGLLDNYIYDLYISNNDKNEQNEYLWITSPKGLSRFRYSNSYKSND